jgi:hypothetical protein
VAIDRAAPCPLQRLLPMAAIPKATGSRQPLRRAIRRPYPSAGSFISYVTRAIGTKVAVAGGVITILGYVIAFGGIYIFAGSLRAERIRQSPYSGIDSDPHDRPTIVLIPAGCLASRPRHTGLGSRPSRQATLAADPAPRPGARPM